MLSDPTAKALPKSYKGCFPFRIAAPSFIYPAAWVPNIRLLGAYLDEIEILIFDSGNDADFPPSHDIDQMALLAKTYSLTYNVHLPIDISPGSPDPGLRQRAVKTLIRAVRLTEPLDPTACILHLPLDLPAAGKMELDCWRQRIETSVEAILLAGIPGKSLSVETLNYPLEWLEPVIESYDLAVCLDLGHLIIENIDWQSQYHRWAHRINMIHLHGVRNQRDHDRLDALPASILNELPKVLKSFTGTVSMEVFSFENLKRSLAVLEALFAIDMNPK